jgi:hypothetical protein
VSIITKTDCTMEGPPWGSPVHEYVSHFLPIVVLLTLYNFIEGATDAFVRKRRTEPVGGHLWTDGPHIIGFLDREVHFFQHGADGVQSIAGTLYHRQAVYKEAK